MIVVQALIGWSAVHLGIVAAQLIVYLINRSSVSESQVHCTYFLVLDPALVQLLYLKSGQGVQQSLAALHANAHKQMIVSVVMLCILGHQLDLLPQLGAPVGPQLHVDQAIGAVSQELTRPLLQAQIVVVQLM